MITAMRILLFLPVLIFFHCVSSTSSQSSNSSAKQTFIALLDPLLKPTPFPSHQNWYSSFLSSSSSSSFIHAYNTLIHGFSATLTLHQVKKIQNSPGVLSVFPDRVLHLHTTRSPSFLGLNSPHLPSVETSGLDTIIGFIDTGIWPEHPSFSDSDLGPDPVRWNGQCENGFRFNHTNCNRKIIGARFFSGGYEAWFGGSVQPNIDNRSPRDTDGHGTHVASIAAGTRARAPGFVGFAGGLARGVAPRSRIAVYKVCWASGCLLSDVCAAFEKAISDGVDIISISLGSSRLPFHLDLLSILSFRAFRRGIFVAASAGNEGPDIASTLNEPPWITTVGSSTIDRDFPANVRLGNGMSFPGTSITLKPGGKLTRKYYPLHFAGSIGASSKFNFSRQSVEGRIVFCVSEGHMARLSLGAQLKHGGAVAMIISHGRIDPNGIISEPHMIPTITVGVSEAQFIKDYVLSGENSKAKISSRGTISMHAKPAPILASFSSRGPNSLVPGILKPDLIAPGLNILGAWTDAIGPSGLVSDNRRSGFNIMSGTSMACPHVSGAAALIKSANPGWGPSEIKSALMTTSTMHKSYYKTNVSSLGSSLISDESTGNPATPFDVGAGHIQPVRALDPGLVFDLDYQDYVDFFCELNYKGRQLEIMTGEKTARCSEGKRGLNYPAIVVETQKVWHSEGIVLVRRLKNVNHGSKEYRAELVGPKGYYKVGVTPRRLKFSGLSERLSFKISIQKNGSVQNRKNLWFGAVIWREKKGKHRVKCPIVIFSSKAYLPGN